MNARQQRPIFESCGLSLLLLATTACSEFDETGRLSAQRGRQGLVIVQDDWGQGIEGALVAVHDANGSLVRTYETGPDGSASVQFAPRGSVSQYIWNEFDPGGLAIETTYEPEGTVRFLQPGEPPPTPDITTFEVIVTGAPPEAALYFATSSCSGAFSDVPTFVIDNYDCSGESSDSIFVQTIDADFQEIVSWGWAQSVGVDPGNVVQVTVSADRTDYLPHSVTLSDPGEVPEGLLFEESFAYVTGVLDPAVARYGRIFGMVPTIGPPQWVTLLPDAPFPAFESSVGINYVGMDWYGVRFGVTLSPESSDVDFSFEGLPLPDVVPFLPSPRSSLLQWTTTSPVTASVANVSGGWSLPDGHYAYVFGALPASDAASVVLTELPEEFSAWTPDATAAAFTTEVRFADSSRVHSWADVLADPTRLWSADSVGVGTWKQAARSAGLFDVTAASIAEDDRIVVCHHEVDGSWTPEPIAATAWPAHRAHGDTPLATFYADADGDGHGGTSDVVWACAAPAGYASDPTDCDDTDPGIHPGAIEACNGLDDDCDGEAEPEGYLDPGSGECLPYTSCTDEEFESVPPTPTSDRVCSPLTVCGSDEYESVEPTPTSDRVCTPVTTCPDGVPEWLPPTPTSDRICGGTSQISVGGYHTCALSEGGVAAVCWVGGFNQVPTTVPPGLGPLDQIDAGVYHTCAVDAGGTVTCWGDDSYGQSTVPMGLSPVVQVDAGLGHTCALDAAGAVTCWGDDSSGQSTVPGPLGTVVQITTGLGSHTCALDDAGTVTCWGANEWGQSTVPASLGTIVQIDAGQGHTCAIDDGGTLTCWGFEPAWQYGFPSGTFVQVAAGGNHTCALDAGGTVTCWGDDVAGQTTVPTPLGPVVAIDLGYQRTCALDDAGAVTCWGDNFWGQSEVPASLGAVVDVSAGQFHTCAVDVAGDITCWGQGGQDDVPIAIDPFTEVSAGGGGTACALDTSGTVSCWPAWALPVPDGLGTIVQVDTGLSHACALDDAGGVTCWGSDLYGQSTVPALALVTQVDAGAYDTCAVDVAGSVTCWGLTLGAVPDDLAGVVSVSVGGGHACAVDAVGGVTCWGFDQYGEATVPDFLGPVVQVSAGALHTCAVDVAGTVTCWGLDDQGQSTVPDGLGTIVQVSAGGGHTCALDDAGAVTCWGFQDDGQPVP